MGLSIRRIKDQESMKLWTADKKVYLDSTAKKVVPEGDKKAAFLLCGPGQRIPYSQAVELGLAPAEVKERPPVEDKESRRAEDKGLLGRLVDRVKGE